MAVIEDPKNRTTAEIGIDRKLKTNSVSLPEATHHSVNGEYFLACNGAAHQNADGCQLWITNNSSTQDCLIEVVQISPSQSGFWHLGKGGSSPTGTLTSPINLNLSSSRVSSVSAYYGNPITFGTNPSKFTGGFVSGYTKYIEEFRGSIILGTGNSLGIFWTWASTAGTVAMGIQFYMRTKE